MSDTTETNFEDRYNADAPLDDRTALWKPALRDVVFGLTALSLFAAADAWYSITGSVFAATLSILDGIFVGGVLTGLIHEWGHFTGARLSNARSPLGKATSLPVFIFDLKNKSDAQFQSMSIGGNVAHWATFFLLLAAMPLNTPGTVAIVCSSFGFATFASVLEVPVILASRRGMKPAEALALIAQPSLPAAFKRGATIGIGAALALSLIL